MRLNQEGTVIMEKKTPIIVTIILLIGLASGFILGSVIYQPQIQALRNDLTTLQEDINSSLTENQALLSALNATISKLNATIQNLTSTSGTPQNQTEPLPEIMEVQSAEATTNGTHFNVTFTLKNSGATNATIVMITLNQQLLLTVSDATAFLFNGAPYYSGAFSFPILAGASAQFTLTLQQGVVDGLNLQSGDTISLVLTSARQNEYYLTLPLP